jgi:site-specific recombinase XerD
VIKRNREPQVLSYQEKLALLKQPNQKAPTGLRNLCIISLMLKTGLRVSEVINLREDHIDWDTGSILIEGSGGAKERILLIDESELNLIKNWRQIKPKLSSLVFTTLKGKKLKDRYIREMIKRLARKAELKKDVFPHLLRLTFAVDFLDKTKDPKLLQEALGHRGTSTTYSFIDLYFKNLSGFNHNQENQTRTSLPVRNENSCFEDNNSVFSPTITILAENSKELYQPIPALKCCHCNYILHYQGDCPQCGTSFNAILKHWGKTL